MRATRCTCDGEKVVDIWGGVADVKTGAPYTDDSLQLVFSTTKGATAACANLLAQRGELDIDAPVAKYWPEFAQAGKENIPVRWLLCHKAGLPTVDAKLTADEVFAWDPIIHALEVQEPYWEPGTAHGYHAITYGYLVGEVVRRISGKSLGTFWHDEIAEPLDLEFWIGLPAGAGAPRRAARRAGCRRRLGREPTDLTALLGPDALDLARVLAQRRASATSATGSTVPRSTPPRCPPPTASRTRGRSRASTPRSIGGVENGPSDALLTPEQIDFARTCQTEGADRVLSFPGIELPSTIGLGFWTVVRVRALRRRACVRSLRAPVARWDSPTPKRGIAGGYVMNRMMQGLVRRPALAAALIKASYDAVGAPAAFV